MGLFHFTTRRLHFSPPDGPGTPLLEIGLGAAAMHCVARACAGSPRSPRYHIWLDSAAWLWRKTGGGAAPYATTPRPWSISGNLVDEIPIAALGSAPADAGLHLRMRGFAEGGRKCHLWSILEPWYLSWFQKFVSQQKFFRSITYAISCH